MKNYDVAGLVISVFLKDGIIKSQFLADLEIIVCDPSQMLKYFCKGTENNIDNIKKML